MIVSDNPFAYLFGVYLGQDWPEDYGSWELAVDAFKRDNPHFTQATIAAVDNILKTSPETELQMALERIACAYDPTVGDGGYRGWLQAVRERLTVNADT